jgi:hypothetical protein
MPCGHVRGFRGQTLLPIALCGQGRKRRKSSQFIGFCGFASRSFGTSRRSAQRLLSRPRQRFAPVLDGPPS